MIPPRPGSGRAPSATLPLRYLVAAASSFLLAAASVPWLGSALTGHYYQPRVLALTHTVALGWITLAIMGASYQLVPIVLERPVFSERLGRWQFVILAGGIAGMVGHFFLGESSGLLWAAGIVALGVLLHAVNLGLSLRGLARWSLTARCVALALGGLGLTVAFGLLLAVNRVWRVLPTDPLTTVAAHFHLALLGWVAPMVMGVAARVYPMFLLAPEPGGWPGSLQLWGLGLGVPVLVAGLLAAPAPALAVAGALAVVAALAAHAVWVAGMAGERKRPGLDWGLRFVFTGTAFLGPAALAGLGLASGLLGGPRAAMAYAVLALGGWVSLTIVGMMLKIVPFLVWFQAYGARVGREPVPTIQQLGWPRAERAAYGLLVGGTAALAVAVGAGTRAGVTLAGAALAAGALAFLLTLGRILRHLGTRPGAPAPAASREVAAR